MVSTDVLMIELFCYDSITVLALMSMCYGWCMVSSCLGEFFASGFLGIVMKCLDF